MILEEIRKPIEEELKHVEIEFQRSLKSNVGLIDQIVQHIACYKGKRLRPIFLLLCSGMMGGITRVSIKAASIVELLHTATLVHDDVVDEADIRRGGPSVNSIWQNKTSILMGDFIFSSVLYNLSGLNDLRLIHVISNVAKRMSQGELLQLQHGHNHDIEEETYFELIAEKTASLLSASCELGGLTAASTECANNEEYIRSLRRFGDYLGMAFQIRDDLLDFTGNQETLGKPIANDLLENIITLPLLYALKQSSNHNLSMIRDILDRGIHEKDVDIIIQFARDNGGIEYASKKADEFRRKAIDELNHFTDSIYKQNLIALTDFITQREH